MGADGLVVDSLTFDFDTRHDDRNPVIWLSDDTVGPGENSLTVNGFGFSAASPIEIYVDDTLILTTSSDAGGDLRAPIGIEDFETPESYFVTAREIEPYRLAADEFVRTEE